MTKSSAHPNQITQGLHLRYHPTPETLGLEYQDGGYYTSQVCPRRAAKTKYFLFCEEGNYGSLDRTFWEERTLQTYCLSCLQARISCKDFYHVCKQRSRTLMIPMEPNMSPMCSTVTWAGIPDINTVSSWYSLGAPRIVSIWSDYELSGFKMLNFHSYLILGLNDLLLKLDRKSL